MKIITLIENTAPEGLAAEWGLSLYIEYHGKNYLLDTGASGTFLQNAATLGVDITKVDAAVLSHAHYDHAGGMEPFFAANQTAPFYVREGTAENCYGGFWLFQKYIGIPKGILFRRKDRIVKVTGSYALAEGVWLLPHRTPELAKIGRRAHLYIRRDSRHYEPDRFAHEQSLVFETSAGLVICNSCSHGRADNILAEVRRALPGRPVCAYIGGLHLYGSGQSYVEAYGKRLAMLNVPAVYTGHCTGKKAFARLKVLLGRRLHAITTGTIIDLPD